MRIRYYISAKENPLYGKEYYYQGRFQTYGQHSFIYDFVTSLSGQNNTIDLIVEDIKAFPIYKVLNPYCNVIEWRNSDHSVDADVVLVDVINENMIEFLPSRIPKVCIIHNAGTVFQRRFIEFCDCFVCMTETAWNFQSKTIPLDKLVLIHQGIDLNRFKLSNKAVAAKAETPSVLVFTRMIPEKRETIIAVLSELKESNYHVTVLGDGPLFWEISDHYGDKFVVINYIPYHSIPTFLQRFDLVISSGRGIMESCASGKPTICAGLGYGGLIRPDNVRHLLKRNLTGYGEPFTATQFQKDISDAFHMPSGTWHKIARSHFDVNMFIEQIQLKIGQMKERNMCL